MARESCVAEAGSAAAALFCWVRDSAPGLGKRPRGAETRDRPASAWVKGELRGRGPSLGPGLSSLGCGWKERVRREGLPAVPEGPAANWGLRTGGTEPLRVDPTFRAERPFWESSRLPERLGRQRGGWTERRSLGARARRATCVIESFFRLEDGRFLSSAITLGSILWM